MACYHPLQAYQLHALKPNGKSAIVFKNPIGTYKTIELPCGQCIGCRLERSRQWAIRCIHEASLHDQNCFITLTYNDDNLPSDKSVNVRDFQLFMKRLRKKIHPIIVRFFHCGEYGEKNNRPHYHACLFGYDFPDRILFKKTNDVPLFTSALLDSVWGLGFSTIGDVTFDSAAYVARYIMKKVNGDNAKAHYEVFDENGEIHNRRPEYTTMSRRPGIARDWFERYQSDIYPADIVVTRGRESRPPRYYDSLYEIHSPEGYKNIKIQREEKASLRDIEESSTARRLVREKVLKLKLQKLPRDL